MKIVSLIIGLITIVYGIYVSYRLIGGAIVVKKNWKEREPTVREFIERRTGEKIEFATLLMGAKGEFHLWIALTYNPYGRVPMVNFVVGDEDRKHSTELTLILKKGQYESLGRYFKMHR